MRANGNHANGCFTCRRDDTHPSILAATGNLNGNFPINTYVMHNHTGNLFNTNDRNSACNNAPLTDHIIRDICRMLTGDSVVSGTIARNRFVHRYLIGDLKRRNIADHNTKVVVNVTLPRSVSYDRLISQTHSRRGLVVGIANNRIIHLLPPLGVDHSRDSRITSHLVRLLGPSFWFVSLVGYSRSGDL